MITEGVIYLWKERWSPEEFMEKWVSVITCSDPNDIDKELKIAKDCKNVRVSKVFRVDLNNCTISPTTYGE